MIQLPNDLNKGNTSARQVTKEELPLTVFRSPSLHLK